LKIDDRSVDRLYEIFRRKMTEVYSQNFHPDPFGDMMAREFNAWQKYLRESLSLDVIDVDHGDRPGLVSSPRGGKAVRILNPSNGASFSHELIVLPLDFAEKVLLLGGLPEEI